MRQSAPSHAIKITRDMRISASHQRKRRRQCTEGRRSPCRPTTTSPDAHRAVLGCGDADAGLVDQDRRRRPGRRGTAPEEGAPRPARRPDPARLGRVGQPLPRLRLAGRRHSVRLLRRLARLVGGLRPDPTLQPVPGHATPRHPVDDDGRADAGRRVPSRPEGSGCGASSLRSERSSSSRCVRRSAGSSPSSWSSCSRASRARCSSRTRISRCGSRARCWR